jgi:hypothetical protein
MKSVQFPILSVLIERANDLVLFDTGIGTRIEEEMRPPIYWGNLFFHRCVNAYAVRSAARRFSASNCRG